MQKITPCIWFNNNAQEVIDFYTSVFPDTKIISKTYFPESNPHGTPGALMTVEFELLGTMFTALNGGDYYTLTGGISLVIHCENQEEVDFYWEKLGDGAKSKVCGWITDKFGVVWQVVPKQLMEMFLSGEKEKVERLNAAMMKMEKLDIADLQRAFNGE